MERLKNFGEHSPEHLLGDLLNYWRRERSANTEPKFAEAASEFAALYGDPDFIANLTLPGIRRRRQSRRAGEERALHLARAAGERRLRDKKRNVLFTGVGVERGYGYIPDIDLDSAHADDALARALTKRPVVFPR